MWRVLTTDTSIRFFLTQQAGAAAGILQENPSTATLYNDSLHVEQHRDAATQDGAGGGGSSSGTRGATREVELLEDSSLMFLLDAVATPVTCALAGTGEQPPIIPSPDGVVPALQQPPPPPPRDEISRPRGTGGEAGAAVGEGRLPRPPSPPQRPRQKGAGMSGTLQKEREKSKGASLQSRRSPSNDSAPVASARAGSAAEPSSEPSSPSHSLFVPPRARRLSNGGSPSDRPAGYCVAIKDGGGRALLLRLQSEEARDAWLLALQQCIAAASRRVYQPYFSGMRLWLQILFQL
jgi:hypothetical protein